MSAEFSWPENWNRDPGYITLAHVLIEHHGIERAIRIMAGLDVDANSDLKAWRELGSAKP